MPNRGQIRNIEDGVVVETNAVFSCNSVRPVVTGDMEKNIMELTRPHIYTQNAVVEACMKQSLKPAFKAFASEALVCLPIKEAEELFEGMVRGTSKYLGYYTE